MNILNSANTAATINKIIHNAQGTTKTSEGATAAGKIIKENLPDIISAGFDMPHPTSVFEGVPPFSFISNGDPLINWTIYGNTVEGVSVGENTSNLCDFNIIQNGYFDASTYQFKPNDNYRCFSLELAAGTYTILAKSDSLTIRLLRLSSATLGTNSVNLDNEFYTFTLTETETIYASMRNSKSTNDFTGLTIMLNTGDTALPYEPYGYKIPVVCGGVTTNIYIDEPLTAGETITYNETGVIIPTTMFLNTLSVGTTVQPEKVFIEYVK